MPTNMITTAFVLLIPLPPNPLTRSQYQQFPKVCQSRQRRFLPPWTVDEHNKACFIVNDATGQALGYFYFEDEPGRRSADVRFEATAVIGCVSSETTRSRMTVQRG